MRKVYSACVDNNIFKDIDITFETMKRMFGIEDVDVGEKMLMFDEKMDQSKF